MRQNLKADLKTLFSEKLLSLSEPAGLYIHIPFCIRKCFYCDFYSITDMSFLQPFMQALLQEIDLLSPMPLPIDTLYLGGGTPSLLEVETVSRIIESAGRSFDIQPAPEITIEVNPGTVNTSRLKSYLHSGVNRLNIGIQSFQDRYLNVLGRIHSGKQAELSIHAARRAGFENIGLDLIYGIPGQSLPSWRDDLNKAMEFEPEHLSCYLLTYEPATPLSRQRLKGKLHPLNEGTCGDLFEATIEFLVQRGYHQYEVSNFARSASFQSRHNRKYWSFVPYIGLGPGAHSFIEPVRYWNYRNVQRYIEQLTECRQPIEGKEVLTTEQQMIEMIYLGLRTTKGVDLMAFERKFGVNFEALYKETIQTLEWKGQIDVRERHLRLTRKGMRFLDSIAAMFIN